ncbi:hypothetical protein NQK81_13445 [Amycolatopsis roodepoortensis]|uniref:hypothetical protein n=1 Tax=Amycolatopsis roodepoortensis TaxID=700274 RepID=UPI00214CDC97|nr:hypothetical protein [Amycolatopsis roodepoortensis]UUV34410.1 hypothetical protein NQK81_13445 [Amycolatopsis roodepoortensis]
MTVRLLDLNAVRHPVKTWIAPYVWRRAVTPVRPPVDLHGELPALSMRIALLRGCGYVHVTVDESFIPADCTWCWPDRPRITSVRVHSDPRRDRRFDPLPDRVDVCLQCALGLHRPRAARGTRVGAVGQALAEARPGAVILVEVCE